MGRVKGTEGRGGERVSGSGQGCKGGMYPGADGRRQWACSPRSRRKSGTSVNVTGQQQVSLPLPWDRPKPPDLNGYRKVEAWGAEASAAARPQTEGDGLLAGGTTARLSSLGRRAPGPTSGLSGHQDVVVISGRLHPPTWRFCGSPGSASASRERWLRLPDCGLAGSPQTPGSRLGSPPPGAESRRRALGALTV